MRKFSDLPAMETADGHAEPKESPSSEASLQELAQRSRMRCLGCAAKVGGGSLSRVMARLRETHPQAWLAEASDAAVLAGRVPLRKLHAQRNQLRDARRAFLHNRAHHAFPAQPRARRKRVRHVQFE